MLTYKRGIGWAEEPEGHYATCKGGQSWRIEKRMPNTGEIYFIAGKDITIEDIFIHVQGSNFVKYGARCYAIGDIGPYDAYALVPC